MIKLYNVVIIYDVIVVANEGTSAREAVLQWIRDADEPLDPNHIASLQVVHAPLKPTQQAIKPIVAADVSDQDFATVKGKTNQQVHDMLFKKEGK